MTRGPHHPARPAPFATCALLGAVLVLLAPLPAAAQPTWVVGARIAQAEPSGAAYDAVYGDSVTFLGLQAEARFTSFFLRVAWSEGDADGELISIAPDGTVLPTGEPVSLTLTPVHLSAGWLGGGGAPWTFRAGGGFTTLSVDEESAFFNDSEDGTGFHALAGVGYGQGHWEVGFEALYWQVSDVFPAAGTALGDPDLDALELSTVVSLRF